MACWGFVIYSCNPSPAAEERNELISNNSIEWCKDAGGTYNIKFTDEGEARFQSCTVNP